MKGIHFDNALETSIELFQDNDCLKQYFTSLKSEGSITQLDAYILSFFESEKPTKQNYLDEIFCWFYLCNCFDLSGTLDLNDVIHGYEIRMPAEERRKKIIPVLNGFLNDWEKDLNSPEAENPIIKDINRAVNLLKAEPIFNQYGFFNPNNWYKASLKKTLLYSKYAFIEARTNHSQTFFKLNRQRISFSLQALNHIYLFHFGSGTIEFSKKTYHKGVFDFRKVEETIQSIFDEISLSNKYTGGYKRITFKSFGVIYRVQTFSNILNSFYPLGQKEVQSLTDSFEEVKLNNELSVYNPRQH